VFPAHLQTDGSSVAKLIDNRYDKTFEERQGRSGDNGCGVVWCVGLVVWCDLGGKEDEFWTVVVGLMTPAHVREKK
jgi:hypothetical protein